MARQWFKKTSLLIGLVLLVVGLWSLPASSQVTREYDNNAVVNGGTLNYNEMHYACVANEKSTRAIFQAFGIPNCDTAFQGMVEGRVTKDNKVFVGDKLVATNAVTAGRQKLSAGDTPIAGGAAYRRAPSVSFRSNSLPAFVKLDNGVFKYAVIMSCGNPVTATPVSTPPPPPKEQPKKPNFDVVKDVRIQGEQAWQQHVVAKHGQKLEYRITVRNTGETDLKNVRIRDDIPKEVTYESGSIRINGQSRTGNLITGFVAGDIVVGKSLELTFVVTVKSDVEACTNPAVNTGFAKPDDLPEEGDNATFQVCRPNVPPPPVTTTTVVEKHVVVQKELPKTGVGGAAAIFFGTTALGTAFYRLRSFYVRFLNQ